MKGLGSEMAVSASGVPREITAEIEDFQHRVGEYLNGTLAPDDFKKCRLQLGIYGLRGIKDKQMVRVKIPSGKISAEQFERLADLTDTFATGRGHVTTRQDIQLYEVPVERTPELLRRLADAGLTTREACGNTVRNVTACPFAGLCPDELFDVSPYSLAVTRYFLRNPVCQALPRKFKISFSGCAHDCAMAPIHDIGAVTTVSTSGNGHPGYGFTLSVGGGLGPIPMSAQLLEPFTPLDRLLPTCEAVILVFEQHGERKNRQRARMKFLIERIGFNAFRKLVFAERDRLLSERAGFPALPAPQPAQATETDHTPLPAGTTPAMQRWLATNIRPQRETGFAVVTVRLLLGDLTASQMRQVAGLARRYAKGQLITTQWQDVCLPWVRFEALPALYEELVRIQLALPDAERIQDITACPGADTCQIGVTSSRGLARALMELLERPEYKTEDLKALRIKISGCPNSCGQHHIADIGFFGAARSVGGKLLPHYQLLLGGGIEDGRAQFGAPVVKLPAKHVPQAVERLLQQYRRERYDRESFHAFVQRIGVPTLAQQLEDLTVVQPQADASGIYQDWGRTEEFNLGGMGQGECAG